MALATSGDGVPAAYLSTHARLAALRRAHEALIDRKNEPETLGNGIYTRYRHPVLTGAHAEAYALTARHFPGPSSEV